MKVEETIVSSVMLASFKRGADEPKTKTRSIMCRLLSLKSLLYKIFLVSFNSHSVNKSVDSLTRNRKDVSQHLELSFIILVFDCELFVICLLFH